MKKCIALLLTIVLLMTALAVIANATGAELANATEVCNGIELGMSYADVVELVGYEGVDVGSGAVIIEFELAEGALLRILFRNKDNSTETDWKLSQTVYTFTIRDSEGNVIRKDSVPVAPVEKITVQQAMERVIVGMRYFDIYDEIGYSGKHSEENDDLIVYELSEGASMEITTDGKELNMAKVIQIRIIDADGNELFFDKETASIDTFPFESGSEATDEEKESTVGDMPTDNESTLNSDNISDDTEINNPPTEKEYDCQRGCSAAVGTGALMVAVATVLGAAFTKKKK